MSIVITGATGQLGRLVVEQLMAAGTPPDARKRLEAMLITVTCSLRRRDGPGGIAV